MTIHHVAVPAKDGNSSAITGGVRQHDQSGGGTGPNVPEVVLVDSTGVEVLGTTADAKNAATDTTAVSVIAILKQLSAYLGGVLETASKLFAIQGGVLTRSANTTAYTANQSISNNTVAGSVTAMPFTISDAASAPVALKRLRIVSTDTGIANVAVRAWLFNSDPTASSGVQAGDGATYSNKMAGLIGSMSGVFTPMADGSVAILTPDVGSQIITTPGGGSNNQVWWQLQTLGAFTPLSASTFTPTLEGKQGRA